MILNSVEWKEFKVKELFETYILSNGVQVPTGAYIRKENLFPGSIPRITVRDTNNGIDGFYNTDDSNYREYSNFISVSFLGSVFYHPYTASLDMKVHALILKERKLTLGIAKFLIMSIKNNTSHSSYGNQLSSTDLPNMKIILPIDENGQPNYRFMEKYINQSEIEMKSRSIEYMKKELSRIKFDSSLEMLSHKEWKEFFLVDIFKYIKRGKRLTKKNQKSGDIPYVSSSSLNNGVDNFICNEKGVRKFNNCLSVANSGSVGCCFYEPFEYVASDHVTCLKNENMNKYIYLFLSALISRLKEKYNFNREINDSRILREKVLLPVNKVGDPDYKYMEQYIKNIEYQKINRYLTLSK